ncbi:hypothetical protein [Asticcacaulis sp. AC402]|uniref:hypothetical protein n=1 Tax=Asticcacaulis sp. AC402 TaxID=1282361 RepID=UPI0003C40040|nr:hypothetical protein [Asticcacaulis sp. AC402]ESQ76416.1 hypothetical protein ABAC402_04770 [Asticcacaulis sp. AC402]
MPLAPFVRSAAISLALIVAFPSLAMAQDDQERGDGQYRRDDDQRRDYDYDRRDDRVPYAGADLAYDYLSGEYYRFEGPRQQDPRAREQSGYRDGVLQTKPNNGHYAGVRWIGGQRRYRGCGCSAWYGRSHSDYRSSSYAPNERSNGYFERYASSNSNAWGYSDRRSGYRFFNYGY